MTPFCNIGRVYPAGDPEARSLWSVIRQLPSPSARAKAVEFARGRRRDMSDAEYEQLIADLVASFQLIEDRGS